MTLLSNGLKFIIYTSLLKDTTLGIEKKLVLSIDEVPVLLTTPNTKEKGLIISFTGFALAGYKDKRMAAVNNAFGKLGYRVITPQIKEIDLLLINPDSIDEIKEVIIGILNDPILNPNKFVPAVFAPSFTAGIAALAIAEMPKNTVSSLCLMGSFCNFESTIEFAIANEANVDDYGMHIIMKNFLKYALGNNLALAEILQVALTDNGLKRQIPELPMIIAQTDTDTTILYKRLVTDGKYRKELTMDALNKIPDSATWKNKLDLSKHASKISCPVTIIHGKDDNVIPAAESILLNSLILKKNKNVHLELSGLLDHGNVQFSFSVFKEVANMAKAINYFLDCSKKTF
jgi:pimeloyl-ACP methyl ester carboxylesterase